MFLATQFDKHIKRNYNMSAANPKKIKVLEKLGAGG
jgi:hypothetical protein